jgi:RNA polymerase sigma-70 factor (ECF subfamily)
MLDERSFQDWIARVRKGDEEAAAQIVRHFEPELRRVIRLRLTDPFLRRLFDSSDICQSVMANFFVRLSLGQFHLEQPQNLLNLLVTMARNKVLNLARDKKREKHARQAPPAGQAEPLEQAAAVTPPIGQSLAYGELLERAKHLLGREESRLVELRLSGKTWGEIGDHLSESPEAVRKRYSRALERIAGQLGLDDSHERAP